MKMTRKAISLILSLVFALLNFNTVAADNKKPNLF